MYNHITPHRGDPDLFLVGSVSVPLWVKSLLGTFNKRDDEPFDGNVQAIAKAACLEAQVTLPEGEPPFAEPVLAEDTFEPPLPPPP